MSQLFLVTGGGRGLGRAICNNLMKHIKTSETNDTVVMCVRKGFNNASLSNEEQKFMNIVTMDVTNEEEVKKCALLVEAIRKEKGHKATTLINNAGLGDDLNWKSCTDPEAAARVLSVNVNGVERVTSAILPTLLSSDKDSKSRIINISSGASQMNISRSSPAMQKQLLSPEGVSWNDITEMIKTFTAEYKASLASGGEHPSLSESGFWLQSYGFSKALLNAYSVWLSHQYSSLTIHCCTPGFVLTDMVSDYKGDAPLMTPEQGAETPSFLALGGADDVPTSFFREKKVSSWAPTQ